MSPLASYEVFEANSLPAARQAVESQRTDDWLSSHSWCLALSNPGKKGSQFTSQLPASGFVLRIFGNTRNLFNPNASRLGKYIETLIFREGLAQSYQLVAVVLHLGNFKFTVDWNNECGRGPQYRPA